MKGLTDDLVKGIFDNVRNLVLSSVVISTGVIIGRSGFDDLIDWYLVIIGIFTIVMGLALYSINIVHAWIKFRTLNTTKYSITALSIAYALVTLEFVEVLWVNKVAITL